MPVRATRSLTEVASYPCFQKHRTAASKTAPSSNSLGLAIPPSAQREFRYLAILSAGVHSRTDILECKARLTAATLRLLAPVMSGAERNQLEHFHPDWTYPAWRMKFLHSSGDTHAVMEPSAFHSAS